MVQFSDLFRLRNVPQELVAEESIPNQDKHTYKEWGFIHAGRVTGEPTSFSPCLHAIKIQCEQEQREDLAKQETARSAIANEISNLSAKIANFNIEKNNYTEELEREEKKIEENKNEIRDIKNNPAKVLGKGKSSSWLSFVIGVFIIAFLTIYLFVFYSSASYSAFFKVFSVTEDVEISAAIFDSQALGMAVNDGFTELILICTIPFVFLGLGFLIHKFGEEEGKIKYLKITALFVITFIFDTILAYKICSEIYDVKAAVQWEGVPPYSFSMAVTSNAFWTVIFSGFIVYVIWGLVFNFIMAEYGKLDQVAVKIKTLEDKISDYKKKCNELKGKIQKCDMDINTVTATKEQMERTLNNTVIIDKNLVVQALSDFTTGWIQYMSGISMDKAKQDSVKNSSEQFINQYKISA